MTAVVTPLVLRDAIAEALWAHVRAQDLAEMCVYLGLEPQGEYENPFNSKRGYVRGRLLTRSMDELAELARKVVAQFGDEDLAKVLERLGAHGVAGDLKNLIFAADGPKPGIVLRDAVSNVIEIVENAEHCLVYEWPLAEHGLTWSELVDWWMERCRSTVARQEFPEAHRRGSSSPVVWLGVADRGDDPRAHAGRSLPSYTWILSALSPEIRTHVRFHVSGLAAS